MQKHSDGRVSGGVSVARGLKSEGTTGTSSIRRTDVMDKEIEPNLPPLMQPPEGWGATCMSVAYCVMSISDVKGGDGVSRTPLSSKVQNTLHAG